MNIRGRWRGKKQQVDTYIDINLPYPDARCASVLCGPQGPCKYIVKGGGNISEALVLRLVPNIAACFGIDVAQVLALPLLWAAHEGEMSRNSYTFPIILPAHASDLKRKWVEAGKSSTNNPIAKIGLAVQQLGDQLCIVPLRHMPSNSSGNSGEYVGAVGEDASAVAVPNNNGEVMPAKAGPQQGCSKSLDSEILFSQQFLLQQRVEDLRQEILTSFGDQRRHIRNVSSAVKRIAIQPIIRPQAAIPQMVEAPVCIL